MSTYVYINKYIPLGLSWSTSRARGVLHLAIIPLFSVARELPLMIWDPFLFLKLHCGFCRKVSEPNHADTTLSGPRSNSDLTNLT